MHPFWKYAAPVVTAAAAVLLCGCAMSEPITPYHEEDDSRVIEYPEGAFTTTEMTTTTTTDAYTPPDDPALVEAVRTMTVEEKAAQMILAGCTDENVGRGFCSSGAGGLCLFAQPFEYKSAEQVRDMTAGFQAAAKIPLLLSVDEEGGTVNRVSLNPQLRNSIFFSPRYLFGQGGMELIESDTKEKAAFLLNLGINVNLAPVCDVPLTEGDFIYPRCFSTDAAETADYIRDVVGIMKDSGLGSTLKHFPGYGGSADTHKNMAYDDRGYDVFAARDFLPFEAGIEAGADAVMVSHNIVACMDADYPASLSPEVHRILREELGFRGVIVSDDLAMNAITQFTNGQNPAVAAVLAGNDMLCYGEFQASVDAITAAVAEGVIDEEQLDASVLRILAWKQSLGLLEVSPTD